ncbi:unnamed protein product [Leptosia nina]|uniref:Uncharacterized protein n=1 Tax=Leptosia nina TaxID=320188 RepID=A0AAV1JB88_9NEOP
MSYSWSTLYYKEDIKNLLVKLTITLKNKYNNKKIEEDMLRKAVLYSSAYVASCSVALFFYAFDAVVQVLKSGGTFTTVVVAWPDVAEIGLLPDTVRIIAYAMWWYFMIRASAVYVLVISLTILLSHQYKILQDYFYSLENIFKADVKLEEKENDYENALKFGISIHAETMWCVKECQKVCNWVFSGQIGINFTVFCMLMLQMVNSERTFMSVLATLSTGLALLTTTGFFMCNAGDITVEAGLLPRAIFSSGWQNCRGDAAIRVRKLITLAIAQSQV